MASRLNRQPNLKLPLLKSAGTALAVEAFMITSNAIIWLYEEKRSMTLQKKLTEAILARMDA